ncbi:MAG: hypothetical protein AUJ92_11280 [Armatimonadetes bacterium CG2_30_59_28]|nr:MAG: hypothetical protein AUJ92_11275 [Armatimonadetes bacterium CG2_30_59_28]OIO93935.1 MAG: hypothetical protein AUJ92_11280 [Armatimonadetes bacterium CG2_30_59_28]
MALPSFCAGVLYLTGKYPTWLTIFRPSLDRHQSTYFFTAPVDAPRVYMKRNRLMRYLPNLTLAAVG